MKNILFLEEKFSMQGSTRALIDYAFFNEKLLKNKSFLAFGEKQSNSPWSEPYYKNILENTFNGLKQKFLVSEYKSYQELNSFINDNNIEYVYHIKSGEPTGFVPNNAKHLIHAVFPQHPSNVHGHKFAFVSKWLSDQCSGGRIPYVPHIINVPKIDKELNRKQIRESLNIPDDAFVYGRIGGYNDFDIPFVYESIQKAVNERKDLYFLMICTKPFLKHDRIIYMDPIMSLNEKYRYICATDAMIHARVHGETFGLAVAEFCAMNKPILTYIDSIGKGYMEILRNDAIYYKDKDHLFNIFMNFKPENKDYNSYKQFSPEIVMNKFEETFLK
jgi:hypothetical protein